jgi:hypothetical protein
MATEDVPAEDVVAKYKRLLSLARSSLEANQCSLAAKDQQINQLLAALEEEKQNKSIKRSYGREDDNQNLPRKILCRVDVGDDIWILIEYESSEDAWKSFSSEISLHDFIQRIPGVPLVCPQRCLSVEESIRIVSFHSRNSAFSVFKNGFFVHWLRRKNLRRSSNG